MYSNGKPLLFAGSSHPELAKAMGLQLGEIEIGTFPDEEILVRIGENVRERDVFVMQSLARRPNRYLMELLVIVDALRRASAGSVTAVIPYFAYARQDRKDRGRVPITAKLVANLRTTAGVDRVVTMDLHADQIQGFFDIPVDNLFGRPMLVEAVRKLGLKDLVAVAPDVGSIKIARAFASDLGVDFATINKQRISQEKVEVTTVIGEVSGHDVLLTDDVCSTAWTLVAAAEACRAAGAGRIFAAATHGLLVGGALDRIATSEIEALLVTDTIPGLAPHDKINISSIATLFGKAIQRIVSAESLSALFGGE